MFYFVLREWERGGECADHTFPIALKNSNIPAFRQHLSVALPVGG